MVRAVAGHDRGPPTGDPGANPLTRKLSHFVPLSMSDRVVLDGLTGAEEQFQANVDIVRAGMAPRSLFLVKAGMAIRYRGLPDGGRQIMTFLIPGDLCGLHVFLLKAMDHSIGTITPMLVAPIPRETVMHVFASRPRVSAALWWSSLQEEAILRERIVALGRRDARGRVAYLLCELLWRHEAVGLTEGDVFRLPLTQTELGDALGLTPVHVNRVLREFRERHLITIERKMLCLLDVAALQRLASFDKDYLSLGGTTKEVESYFDMLERQRGRRRSRARAKCLPDREAGSRDGVTDV